MSDDALPTAPPPATEQPPQLAAEAETKESPPPPPAAAEKEFTPPPAAAAAAGGSVVIPEKDPPAPPPVSVTVTEKELPLPTVATAESDPPVKTSATLVEVMEAEKSTSRGKFPESQVSFKEESNLLSDLSQSELKALNELKQLVQEALKTHPVLDKHTQLPESSGEKDPEIMSSPVDVFIWGVPLLKDDRTDVILLKFLRARDFKVPDAFAMLNNTLRWRNGFGIDNLVDENLGDALEKVVFMHGYDKEGHPVCYNVYGEFQNKELYQNTFGDEEKRNCFLRWRIQFLEKSIRKLDYSPGGICTIFQVSDLKNSPGPAKRELRQATRQALHLLQDNYPEFVAKQVFINVPWWYLAFYTMISPFLTQRTKSKFVFAGPSRTAETLFKYISPVHVPIQYGGLGVDLCECNPEFTIDDPATEITVKPATKQTVEIIVNEKCFLIWELRVVGWEVSYSAEYVPSTEGGYSINIQKTRKMLATDEPVISSSFKISELGKILLTVDNPTSKKKKLLYRFKVNPICD